MADKGKLKRKEDWIIVKNITAEDDLLKLDKLLAHLRIDLKEICPLQNDNSKCMMTLVGHAHLIEGVRVILGPGITF